MNKKHLALAALAASAIAFPALADAPKQDPLTPYAEIRYRLEVVDQAGLPNTATASTVRVRAGVKTATWNGFSAVVEGEGIARVGLESYNDTINGRTAYPTVADPSALVLNQAYIRYRPVAQIEAVVGRQTINLDNQRWIGSVGWRQNDQTLDAARLTLRPTKQLTVEGFHAWRVNRVFGPDSPQGIWRDTAIEGARAAYTIKNIGTLSAYGYWLDIPSSPANSTRTEGVRIAGEHKAGKGLLLLYAAEYARQHSFATNPRSYALNYWLVEPGVGYGPFTLRGGYEELEGNGTVAVQTPLATLHAFNGWADKFLTTPANGLSDLYLDAGWKVATKGSFKGLTLRGMWHEYRPTVGGGASYGNEWDASAVMPLTKAISVGAKLARYNANTFATDTTKGWFWVEARF